MRALGLGLAISGLTLWITWWAARRTRTAADFDAADGQLTAAQNGFALAGDWMSAAAFLGFWGRAALYGMVRRSAFCSQSSLRDPQHVLGFADVVLGAWFNDRLGGCDSDCTAHVDEVLFRDQTGEREA